MMNQTGYTYELSSTFLSRKEQAVFGDYLGRLGLDSGVWQVFECLFRSGTRHTQPHLLRASANGKLEGAAIIIKCARYGRALFSNKTLAGMVNLVRLPFYLWLRFGCCMDMMSNPGFARDPENADKIFRGMASWLKRQSLLTVINDYSRNAGLYPDASVLPALPHGLIDVSEMTGLEDYMKPFKNLKRKIKVFRNKKGMYHRIDKKLDNGQLQMALKCFVSTAEKSLIYLPYQDLYIKVAENTSSTSIPQVHYFIATLDGEFLGYQAAVQTGNHLNALHGAFNRDLKTTYHAYDILFAKMAGFAIENGLRSVDFGAVINLTKQKMVNQTIPMSYFVLSKYPLFQKTFNRFLKLTRIQGDDQLKFGS